MKINVKRLEASLKKVEKDISGWKHPACPRCKGPLMAKKGRILKCSNCSALCKLMPAKV